MLRIGGPRKGLKAFEMAQGGDKMEYVFAGALAVVIVGALVLTVYFTFFRREGPAGGPIRNLWQCSKCGAEFSVDEKTQERTEEMDRPRVDCPKCGAKLSALPMTKCSYPDCGKYFVRESVKDPSKSTLDDVCPYCKRNWDEGVRASIRRKKS